ncbi:MAG: SRPBCC domain-containing protein [Planctomycetes bacterium]|nr:SRPBCC domain-containing protein [Planctomycetota bacterium]
MDVSSLSLDVDQHIEITAPDAAVFEGLIRRLGDRNVNPNDEPMPMRLECWPGGRWFRDLGDGTGHLWGFVQVIKPPKLLEIHGPMFMSYAVAGHVAFRVESLDGDSRSSRSKLSVRHRAFGLIEDEHRKGVTHGWTHYLNSVKTECE